MKLLHLNEFYAAVGGLEQYLTALCDVCETAGHQTIVVYGTRTGQEPSDQSRLVYHIPGLAGSFPPPPESLERFAAVLSDEKPDVIVVHQILEPHVVQIASKYGPTIRFAHGFKMICPGGRKMWNGSHCLCPRPAGLGCQVIAYRERCMPRNPLVGLRAIMRTRRIAAIHRESSEVVVASGFMRDLILQNGFSREHVHVVPYFTFLPDLSRQPAGPIPGRLFCAARLTPEKGVDHLLRALVHLPPNAHLVIAGEGPSRGELEHLAHALGLSGRVDFVGWLPRGGISTALSEADVVVVPSLWPEPFGIVGIEAMAHARPVVAYDVGGVREWLAPEETGCLVKRGETLELAEAIRSLLDKPEQGRALGRHGRRVAEVRFSPERHLQDFLAVAATAAERWWGCTGRDS